MAARTASRSLKAFRDLRRAKSHLKSFGTPAEAPVVPAAVFDIDGTVIGSRGSAVEHGAELCGMAADQGCSIHYITARIAPTNRTTVRQLKKAGLPVKNTSLQSRPVDSCATVETLKYEQRKRVSSRACSGEDGKKACEDDDTLPVWLNVGNSISDVLGAAGIAVLAQDMGLQPKDVVHLLRHAKEAIIVLHGYDDSSWVSILVPPEKGDRSPPCTCRLCSSKGPMLWT